MAQQFMKVVRAEGDREFEAAVDAFFLDAFRNGWKITGSRFHVKGNNFVAFITYFNPN